MHQIAFAIFMSTGLLFFRSFFAFACNDNYLQTQDILTQSHCPNQPKKLVECQFLLMMMPKFLVHHFMLPSIPPAKCLPSHTFNYIFYTMLIFTFIKIILQNNLTAEKSKLCDPRLFLMTQMDAIQPINSTLDLNAFPSAPSPTFPKAAVRKITSCISERSTQVVPGHNDLCQLFKKWIDEQCFYSNPI